MKTAIKQCICVHAGQDKLYNARQRVHNFAPGREQRGKKWRCTVCQREQDARPGDGA